MGIGVPLEFDGQSAYFDFADASDLDFPANAPFTVAGWVKATAGGGMIFSFRNKDDGGPVINLNVQGGGVEAIVRQNGIEDGEARVNGRLVNDGEWRHFALTRDDRGTIELFLDAVSQGKESAESAGGRITTTLRALGSERYWQFRERRGAYFKGCIDEFLQFRTHG